MPHQSAPLRVYTYKEGLLSRVAHDLLHELSVYRVRAREGTLEAEFELTSLEPQGAVVRGDVDRSVLGASELAEIQRTTQNEVLATAKFPKARLSARYEELAERVRVEGVLELHGRTHELAFDAKLEGERVTAAFELRPSDFGIAPYRALFGALRLQDRVRVELSLLRSELSAE